jgi:hypothetical protein
MVTIHKANHEETRAGDQTKDAACRLLRSLENPDRLKASYQLIENILIDKTSRWRNEYAVKRIRN